MPSFARLVAAFILATMSYVVSEQIKPLMTEGTAFGWFSQINAFFGLVTGWRFVGLHSGKGYVIGISNGLTGGIILVFGALLFFASYHMFELSMRGRYDSIADAGSAIVEFALSYGALLASPHILLTLVIGSILAGGLAELVQ